jgi:branched-chain amino acid transport system substrate-binding protein
MKLSKGKRSGWIFPILSIIIMLSLVLAACAQPAKAPAAATGPIKIGGTLPLTGGYADTGKVVYDGYKHWVEVTNANGGLLGRQVALTIYDDAGDVKNAVTLMEKLITVDKVDLLAGGYPGTAAAAQMPVAEQYKKVYISMGGHMASFTKGYTYSFGGPPLMGQWWYEGVWQWLGTMPQEQRPKTAAVFIMNNPIGATTIDTLPDRLKGLGIDMVVNEKYDLPLASADPIVAKAKAANAELFISGGFLPDGVLTVKAAKTQNYNPKLYLQSIGSVIPAWVSQLGADGNYICSGTPLSYLANYPGVADLNKWYSTTNPPATNAPDYFISGYCWLQVLQRGVEGAQSLDDTKIRDYLKSHEISTVAGTLKFDEKGLPPPMSLTTQVINQKVELIWPLNVRTHEPVYPKPEWGK